MVRNYLSDSLGMCPPSRGTLHHLTSVPSHAVSHPPALLDSKPPLKWEPKKWPAVAALFKLVLTGWGPSMPTLPTEDWADKKKGGLTRAQWELLVARIPKEYHNNPYHSVSDGELPLQIVDLADFLAAHTGMNVSALRGAPIISPLTFVCSRRVRREASLCRRSCRSPALLCWRGSPGT